MNFDYYFYYVTALTTNLVAYLFKFCFLNLILIILTILIDFNQFKLEQNLHIHIHIHSKKLVNFIQTGLFKIESFAKIFMFKFQ